MNANEYCEKSASEVEIKEMLKAIANRELKVKRSSDLKPIEKKKLLAYLKKHSEDKKDGKCLCHYCKIYCGENGENFLEIWKHPCYAKDKNGKQTGRMNLEIEHKNSLSKDTPYEDYWNLSNLTLACPICNIAKSDQFTYDEFKEVVGKAIEKVWQKREEKLH